MRKKLIKTSGAANLHAGSHVETTGNVQSYGNKVKKALFLLANFVFVLSYFTSATAQELLFKSGFEDSVYLDPNTEDDYQFIRGTDQTSGYTWPIVLGESDGHLHHIPEAALANGDSYAEIVNVVGHNGTMTRALYKSFYRRPGSPGWSQCGYTIEPTDTSGNELYMSWWEKFSDDFETTISGSDAWRTVWFWKTPGEPAGERVEAYVYEDGDGNPYWHIHEDGEVWGGYQHFNFEIDNKDVPVPMNDWFQHEVYWKRSTENDGRVLWAINYQGQHYVIADYHGQTQNDPENVNQVVWGHVYGMQEGKTYAHWLDDVEIWNRIPLTTKIEPSPGTNSISPQLTVFPNPTRGRVAIIIDSKSTQIINKLGIYSVSGRLIDELKSENGSFFWNPDDATPNGIYLIKPVGAQNYLSNTIHLIR